MASRTFTFQGLADAGAVAALLVAGQALVLSAPHAAAAEPAAVDLNIDCTTISDPTERLNCWDSHAHATIVQKKAANKKLFGLTIPQTEAATTAPQPKSRRHAKVKTARAQEDNRHVVLTIASVGNTLTGRLLLTATDGAVWEQTDSDTIRDMPVVGATFTVRRGPLGGYMCDVTRWQPVRCQRDQ